MNAEAPSTMFLGAYLVGAGLACKVSADFCLVETGLCRDRRQPLDVADVEPVEEIGLEQALYDITGAALERGQADQPVGTQAIRNAADPLEGEIDALAAAGGAD